ncbi:MAG: AraC family transcriptional regulator [Bacteroidales bacterium]|jgi:AraC-like DNA-binding protein/mannose-6-phosphate isomerase-like protein (cupin superfamily)|nr:AraC family transcriptional regulator [Bacteroidales bacterium]
MRKKEVEHLPVRTIEGEFGHKALSKFDIVSLKEDSTDKGIIAESHRHDYYHIMFVSRGNGEHSIDFKTYDIKPNSIFFVSPGQVHSLVIDKNVDGYVVSFDSEFFTLNNTVQKLIDFPFFHSINNDPVLYLSRANETIQNLLDDMYNEYRADEKGKENVLRALIEILLIRSSRMYSQPVINEAPTHLTFQLRKLEALIDTHFKEYKLLNDYADMMYISAKHLNSLCKKGLNKTVTNLIHERTLTEAKRLLLFTDNTISEIAFELGFTDKSYFMRFFKKSTKLTADSFRKQNKDV